MSTRTARFEKVPIESTAPVQPQLGEQLLVYLAISETTVSVVLVREDKGTQSLIYYIIKALIDVETRYRHLEKLAFVLLMTSQKLRPYFQCHTISVAATFPLLRILHKLKRFGWLAK